MAEENKANQVLVKEIVKILVQNTVLMKNWSEFSDHLESPPSEKLRWERSIFSDTRPYYDVFTDMINTWTDRSSKRTVKELCFILRKINCNLLADDLETKYPNDSVIARKVQLTNSKNKNRKAESKHCLETEPLESEKYKRTKTNLKWPISHGCHTPTKNFFGRVEELQQLNSTLLTNQNLQLITGLGGIGKTELCKKFLHDIHYEGITTSSNDKSRTKQKIEKISRVWLNGDTLKTLNDSIRKLGDSLGVKCQIPVNSPGYFDYLSRIVLDNSDILIVVIDNVDESYSEVIGVIEAAKKCSKMFIVVTSRDRNILNSAGIRIVLGDLKREKCRLILKQSLPGITNPDADSLCNLLQDYPLALQQAAAYIREQRCDSLCGSYSVAEYVKEFATKKKIMLGKKLNNLEHDYKKTTWITWDVTIEKMEENSRDILKILGYIKPSGITIDFLKNVCKDFLKLNAEDSEDALKKIVRYSLANVEESVISIHKLVQEIIRLKMIDDENVHTKKLFESLFIVWAKAKFLLGKEYDVSHICKIFRFAFNKTTVNFRTDVSGPETVFMLIDLNLFDCAIKYLQILFKSVDFAGLISDQDKIELVEKSAMYWGVAAAGTRQGLAQVTNDIILNGNYDVGYNYPIMYPDQTFQNRIITLSNKYFGKDNYLNRKIHFMIESRKINLKTEQKNDFNNCLVIGIVTIVGAIFGAILLGVINAATNGGSTNVKKPARNKNQTGSTKPRAA